MGFDDADIVFQHHGFIREHSLAVSMGGYLALPDGPCFFTEGMVHFGS